MPMIPTRSVLASACLFLAATATVADLRVPSDYATVEAALAAIEAGVVSDTTVVLEPGTYAEAITLSSGLPAGVVLRGRETARTVLTEPLDANGIQDARISNLTFAGNGPAVRVNGGTLTVANNVFRLADGATAIAVAISQPTVINNVFHGGGIAIDAGENALTVQNNVFVSNGDTLVAAGAGSIASHNAFSGVDAFGTDSVTGDPLFVDPDAGDFHLRAGSPLIDAGTGTDVLDDTTADIGAYGGDFAEGTPFPVRGLEVVSIDSDGLANRVALRWEANRWYRLGGYRLHYDSDGEGPPYDGTGADEGDSPIDVGDAVTFVVGGLAAAGGGDLEAPELAAPEPRDRALRLGWSSVPGAAGYLVHYRVDGGTDQESIDVGDTRQYTLGGLDNGTDYRVHVTAYARSDYVFTVTAYADFDAGLEGVFSEEAAAAIGPRAEGPPSNEVVDFPEPIVAFPGLPDEGGCFVATAAYGFYGAREVRLLRRFRDGHLITHAPGRAFVAWYYSHSPRWAEALREQPALKPLARAALLPAIALAAFAVHVPVAAKGLAFFLLLAAAAALVRRGRSVRLKACP